MRGGDKKLLLDVKYEPFQCKKVSNDLFRCLDKFDVKMPLIDFEMIKKGNLPAVLEQHDSLLVKNIFWMLTTVGELSKHFTGYKEMEI